VDEGLEMKPGRSRGVTGRGDSSGDMKNRSAVKQTRKGKNMETDRRKAFKVTIKTETGAEA